MEIINDFILSHMPENNKEVVTPENFISASGLIKVFRTSDYTLEQSVLELTDNPLDKGAKNILVHTFNNPSQRLNMITIIDDGYGMDIDKLKKAFKIGNATNNRAEQDIGMYHVGLKVGSLNIGNMLYIVTKTINGSVVGLKADYSYMEQNDVYVPVLYDDGITLKDHFPIDSWNDFINNSSGTMIYVSEILPKHRNNISEVHVKIRKALQLAYVNTLKTKIYLKRGSFEKELIKSIDPFYLENPDALKTEAIHTELQLYKDEFDNYRVIEQCTHNRLTFKKSKKDEQYTGGRIGQPSYIEYFNNVTTDGKQIDMWNSKSMKKINRLQMPKPETLIGTINLRIIYVDSHYFDMEPEAYRGILEASTRKGFWFQRGLRYTGAAKQIGQFMNMEKEHMRMNVQFSSKIDQEFGMKYTKQIGNSIPCKPLESALKNIWQQITTFWVDSKPDSKKKKAEEDAKKKKEEDAAKKKAEKLEQDSKKKADENIWNKMSNQQNTVEEESVKEESLEEESVKEESVKEESVKDEPLKEESVKDEPLKEESVKEESVKEEPLKEESVKEEPLKEESVKEETIFINCVGESVCIVLGEKEVYIEGFGANEHLNKWLNAILKNNGEETFINYIKKHNYI